MKSSTKNEWPTAFAHILISWYNSKENLLKTKHYGSELNITYSQKDTSICRSR